MSRFFDFQEGLAACVRGGEGPLILIVDIFQFEVVDHRLEIIQFYPKLAFPIGQPNSFMHDDCFLFEWSTEANAISDISNMVHL